MSKGDDVMRATILSVFVFILFVLSTFAFAQDDFPPPGIYIPCCYGGGTGSSGATYGRNGQAAWKQAWGVRAGDRVTFRFVLRTSSAGSLHAWPHSTDGAPMTYLGDENNPYEKWYWNTGRRDSGGTFCIDCPWQFIARADNPWIYIDYWDSGDGWDVDLNVTSIEFSLAEPIDPQTKDTARRVGIAASMLGHVTAVSAALSFAAGNYPLFGIFSVATLGSLGASYYFERIANDPWDDNYAQPYSWDLEYDSNYDWACQAVYDWDNIGWLRDFCGGFVWINEVANGLAHATAVTADRVYSCDIVGDDCRFWQRDNLRSYAQSTGAWYLITADYYDILASYVAWEISVGRYSDDNNAYGNLVYYAQQLRDVGQALQSVQ